MPMPMPLLCGPSMMVQIGQEKESCGQAGQGNTPSRSRAGELSEERSGTGPADVDQQPIDDDENDEPIDDEYELLCNEAEDAVARSDAALADCSKDEEKTVERAQVASVDEKTASHWHSTQGPTKSLARWSTICGKHTVNQLC